MQISSAILHTSPLTMAAQLAKTKSTPTQERLASFQKQQISFFITSRVGLSFQNSSSLSLTREIFQPNQYEVTLVINTATGESKIKKERTTLDGYVHVGGCYPGSKFFSSCPHRGEVLCCLELRNEKQTEPSTWHMSGPGVLVLALAVES